MKHVIPHNLDTATARKVTERAFEDYKARLSKYNPTMRWTTERRAEVGFHAMGMNLTGLFELGEKQITLDLDVPFLLRPFKNIAIETIDREVKHWITKAEAGEI